MERRIGSRARVDFVVSALVDGFLHHCRAVDLSTSGMLVERTMSLTKRNPPSLSAFRLELPGRRYLFVRGRTVWSHGRYQAVRFVGVHDVDRLTLAEQVDASVN
jgi:hypothetical protein